MGGVGWGVGNHVSYRLLLLSLPARRARPPGRHVLTDYYFLLRGLAATTPHPPPPPHATDDPPDPEFLQVAPSGATVTVFSQAITFPDRLGSAGGEGLGIASAG